MHAMARARLSLPHERRKMALKSTAMKLRVGIAERREQLGRVQQELKAMAPPKKKVEPI